MILCPNCHKDIDTNPHKHTVLDIRKFKEQHESRFKKNPYNISEGILTIYKVSINEDSFAPEIFEFFLNLYLKTDNDKARETIYENRIKYCLTNLHLELVEDKESLKLFIDKILARCSTLEDEKFIRCYLLISDLTKIDLITSEIQVRLKNFLESDFTSSEIPRVYWLVYPQSADSIKLLIKEAGKYSPSLYKDIVFNALLDDIEVEQKFCIEEEIWQLMGEYKNHESTGYQNLAELERAIFNSFSKN